MAAVFSSKCLSLRILLIVGSLFFLMAIMILRRKTNVVTQEYSPSVIEEPRRVEQSKQSRLLRSNMTAPSPVVMDERPTAFRKKTSNMTVGILVAKRQKPTIYNLLDHLLREPRVAEDFIIIVHVAFSVSRDEELLRYLRRLKDVAVTVVEENPYPEAMEENIADTRGDSMERTVWRTTHVMDYINLLSTMLAYNTTYNLVLEDDVKPAKHALHKAYEFAVMLENQADWGFLTFYNVIRGKSFVSNARKTGLIGACAWLYRKKVAEGCLKMLRADPQRWPVDLLVPPYVFNTLDLQAYERTPNLFQHISAVSTYTGQDAATRKAETWRGRSFEYDEDNSTAALTPALNTDGYVGCFVDQPIPMNRDLSGLFSHGAHGHITNCRSYCREYYYFGLQYGKECYCGNEFGSHGRAPEDECSMTCLNTNQICGGILRNSVYRVNNYHATFVGCFETPSDFQQLQVPSVVLGIDACGQECPNSQFIGLRSSNLCSCITDIPEWPRLSNSTCNVRCQGMTSEICGGKSASTIAVYKKWS